ncbi:MAG: T9SS type A sorting domain-containing protein [Bacteroidota bacterium]
MSKYSSTLILVILLFCEISYGSNTLSKNVDSPRINYDGCSVNIPAYDKLSTTTKPHNVSWGGIKAEKSGLTETISWKTYFEQDNHHFEILRSTDGLNYFKVGQVKSIGNHQDRKAYSFQHNRLNTQNELVWYRIKQVNIFGMYEYAKTIPLTHSYYPSIQLTWEKSSEGLKMILHYSREKQNKVQVFDTQGNVIFDDSIFIDHSTTLPLHPTAKGIYILTVTNRKEKIVRKIRL